MTTGPRFQAYPASDAASRSPMFCRQRPRPSFAGPHQQAAVLRLQLQDLAELDVQTPGDELGGRVEQIGSRHAGQRLLAEVRTASCWRAAARSC